jgi:hypothetical protein
MHRAKPRDTVFYSAPFGERSINRTVGKAFNETPAIDAQTKTAASEDAAVNVKA